ncbi:30S ribosomal protein S21, chloroplastic [Trifolium repens]|nr:30S ribosomal protein S21, chloroplastic [Trifolium repens]
MAISTLLRATCSLSLLPSSSSPSTRRIDDDVPQVSFSRIAYPTLTYSNSTTSLSVKSAHSDHYNVQIIVEEDEPEEKLINRFKIEVLRARVFQECRRRRFFENKQDKIKRKAREAVIRNRNQQRRPYARFHSQNNYYDPFDFPSKEKDDDSEDEDNWEIFDVDVPYA